MEESGLLIAELQSKLQELDHKVAIYRHDMTWEYTRYAEGLLRNVPDNVSARVRNAVADSMSAYHSLQPADIITSPSFTKEYTQSTRLGELSRTADTIGDRDDASSTLSTTRADAPTESLQDSHAREDEFSGLFTPTYLPLLEDSARTERRASQAEIPPIQAVEITASAPVAFQKPITSNPAAMASSYDNSYEQTYMQHKPPIPKRRNTDDISVFSDSSDGTKRRSALRRSSSASNPKRVVRFEFEGREFGTTSSPMPPAPITEIASADMAGDFTKEPSLLDSDEDSDAEQEAPPKRISSTQSLRALSRGPLEDDGTQWTEVVAPPDGSPSVEGAPVDSDVDSEDDDGPLTLGASKTSPKHDSKTANNHAIDENKTMQDIADAEIAAEEEDIVTELGSVQPLHSWTLPRASSQIPATTPSKPALPISNSTSYNTTASLGLDKRRMKQNSFSLGDDSDEDDMFGFEDAPDKTQRKYLEHDSSDDENVPANDEVSEHPESATAPAHDTSLRTSSYTPTPGSLPRAIAGPHDSPATDVAVKSDRSPSPPPDIPADDKVLHSTSYNLLPLPMNPNVAPSAAMEKKLSAGYHPFSKPIIEPSLYNRISKLQSRPTFVGSLSGKSGPDDSDARDLGDDLRIQEMARERIGSFPDIGVATSFVGSMGMSGPRSLSERMRLEEYMESEKL